jgi:hypothetical protein
MRRIASCLAGCLVIGALSAEASTLNFDSLPGATVNFFGNTNTLVFLPEGGGFDFQITSALGGFADPDTLGLTGNIEGVFTIGSISSPLPGIQQAPVSGSGTFSIEDEAGQLLVATVTWKDIITVGTGGVINMNGLMNLTGVTYSGANADLLQLLISGDGAATITFQFVPARPLSQLVADGTIHSTAYSGSVVPEPATLLLLGSGLTGLGAYQNLKARRRREG